MKIEFFGIKVNENEPDQSIGKVGKVCKIDKIVSENIENLLPTRAK